jgi:hypothetical protein
MNCDIDEKKFLPGFEKPNKVLEFAKRHVIIYMLRINTTVADRGRSTKTFIAQIGFRVSPARTSEFSVSAKRYSDSEDHPFCGRRRPPKN